MKTNATPIVAVLAIALLSHLYASHTPSTPLSRVSTHAGVQTPRIGVQGQTWHTLKAGQTFSDLFRE